MFVKDNYFFSKKHIITLIILDENHTLKLKSLKKYLVTQNYEPSLKLHHQCSP